MFQCKVWTENFDKFFLSFAKLAFVLIKNPFQCHCKYYESKLKGCFYIAINDFRKKKYYLLFVRVDIKTKK